MDLDHLRTFLVVADELSFTRAAARCFISQPALSRRIRHLERQVGRELFTRDAHSVMLTPAGVTFRRCALRILAIADAALVEIRTPALANVGKTGTAGIHASGSGPGPTATPTGRPKRGYQTATLRVGIFHPGAAELTGAIIGKFRAVRPLTGVRLVQMSSTATEDALVEHRVDVALLWGPADPRTLEVRPLFHDAGVAVVAEHHALSAARNLGVSDVLEYPITRIRQARPAWSDYWLLPTRPRHRHAETLAVDSFEDSLLAASSGSAISFSPECLSRYSPVAGVRFIPVDGLAPVTIAVACRKHDHRPLVRSFVAVAEQTAAELRHLVPDTEQRGLTAA